LKRLFLLSTLLLLSTTPARAGVVYGDVAPNWTKNELDAPAPAARSLTDYAGKVVILFLLGYN